MLKLEELERAGYLFTTELGDQSVFVEVMNPDGWTWRYAASIGDDSEKAQAFVLDLAIKKASEQYEEVYLLKRFARYMLKEADAAIEEHGFKSLMEIESNNTKMDIHVFVENLQQIKTLLESKP